MPRLWSLTVPRQLIAAAVLALLVGLAAVGVWLWRRRLRLRYRWRRALGRPPLPVVLVHGLFGFDEIAIGASRHAYFKGIGAQLEQGGRKVVNARLSPVGTIEARAGELAGCIRAHGDARVIVLAHSMGGLDARYAIARFGLASQVSALVTVGTPHRGTPVADLTADLATRLGIAKALSLAGVSLETLQDLTSARMLRFNEEVPDVSSVSYGSVVGRVAQKLQTNPLLLPGYLWMAERAGANDGVVPAASQRWGRVLAEIEADHWAQIGWSKHFDAPEFYAELLRELRGRGF